MILGAIPYGTEIYLEDKTLKKVEDICIGDRLLSLEIKNEKNMPFDFYNKYINKGNSILKSNLKFSGAVVKNTAIKKHSYFKKENGEYVFYNSIFPYRTVTIDFSTTNCMINWLDDSTTLVVDNSQGILSLPTMSEEYIDKILDSDYVYDTSKEIAKKTFTESLNLGDGPFFSIYLLDNFFIFTKNFITLGIIPENLGYKIK